MDIYPHTKFHPHWTKNVLGYTDGQAFGVVFRSLLGNGINNNRKTTSTYCKRIGDLHRRFHVGEEQVRLESELELSDTKVKSRLSHMLNCEK